MNKILALIVIIFACLTANASVATHVHIHKISLEGVLPEPYKVISLEIELDTENDNVTSFKLVRGEEQIKIPESIIEQLRNVTLHSLDFSHEIYRETGNPLKPVAQDSEDWIIISIDFGKEYRVNIDGRSVHGQDRAIISIKKNKAVTFKVWNLETVVKLRYGKQ